MQQLALNGQVAINPPECAWGCGRTVREVSTHAYLAYLKRIRTKGSFSGESARCAFCEIYFIQIVYELTMEQANVLREKWQK